MNGAYTELISIGPEVGQSQWPTTQRCINVLLLWPEALIQPRLDQESIVLQVDRVVSIHVDGGVSRRRQQMQRLGKRRGLAGEACNLGL